MKALVRTFLGILLILVSSPGSAFMINVVPALPSIELGSSVSVAVTVSDLGDSIPPSLSTFDIDLNYNEALLSFTGAVFGDPVLGDQLDLFGLGSLTTSTVGLSLVNLFELSYDSIDDLNNFQAGSFTLFTLSFNAIAAGISSLDLTINSLGDATGEPLLAVDINNGALTVKESTNGTVAEPTIWSLFGIGLVGMGLLRQGKSPVFKKQSTVQAKVQH